MRLKLPKKHYVSIPSTVLIYMAWRNLVTKKLRSFLTLLGVVIGIGAIFFLLSLGIGLQNLVTEEVIGNSSVKSIDIASPNSRIIKLDKELSSKIEGLGHVSKLGNSYSFAGGLKFSGSETDTIVYGVDTNFQELSNLTPTAGRLLKSDDQNKVFVNQALLQAIGVDNADKILNKDLELRIPLEEAEANDKSSLEETFQVVGVVDSGAGSEVYISDTFFEQASIEQYAQSKLLVDDTSNIPALRTQIESLGLETTSPIDTIDQINQIFKYFIVILVGIGAIGMIVAVLGMFNTLTISLLERTKEIALMVALGARHRDMRRLFIIEAVLLSVIGSAVGIFLAVLAGAIVNLGMNQLASGRGVNDSFDLFATPFWLMFILISFMVAVGLAVVYFPARRAEKINPIEALRRE